MVESFIREEPNFVKGLGDELLLAPVNIPVIVFRLLVCSIQEHCWDAVGEVRFEFDVGAMLTPRPYLCTGKYSFLMYFRKYYDIYAIIL